MIDKYSLDIRIVGGGGGKGWGGEGAKKSGEGLIVIFPYKEGGAYRIVGLIWEGGVTMC